MSWSLSYFSILKCEVVDMADESWIFGWKAVRKYFAGDMENSIDLVRRVRSNVKDLIFLLTAKPSFNSNCSWLTCFLGYSRFPYKEETINTWFVQEFRSEDTGEHKEINVMNVDREGKRTKIYRTKGRANNFPNCLSDDNFDVFFHGTSPDSAQAVIERGIILRKARQGEAQDFSDGDGYYVCNSFEDALDWAQRKFLHRQSVLIYRVDKRLKAQLGGLDLRDNKSEWLRVVTEYRQRYSRRRKSGGKVDTKLRADLKKLPFIEGPMTSGSGKPSSTDFDNSMGKYQLCVRNDNGVQLFNNCLHSVVFFEG